MSIGKMFLSAIMAEGSVAALLQYGPVDHLFKASEVDVYAFVKGFVKAHQKIPGPETIEAHTGDALVPHKEPASYYFELMQFRHVELELKKGMKRVSDLMLPENKDVGEALKIMTEAVMELVGQKHAKQVVDFRDAYEIIMADYAAKWNKDSDHGLMFGWPTLDTMSGGMVKGDLISIVGRPQKGKEQPMTSLVLMADGTFKTMGLMQVGDKIASIDGKPSEVYGVYPQGVKRVFKFTFADGRQTEAGLDHLWRVHCKYWDRPRIMSTEDVMAFRTKAKRYANTLKIDLISGCFGEAQPYIAPYVLGVLLGDGCLCANDIRITTMDPEIVEGVTSLLPGRHALVAERTKNAGKATSYRIVTLADDGRLPRNQVKAALRVLGLYGCKSENKFLPDTVFRWPRQERIALLQGLMDTDGTAGTDGGTAYSSSSRRLIDDVSRLVRSLGGKARVQPVEKTTHLDHWRVNVVMPDKLELFRLPRKRDRWRKSRDNGEAFLHIVEVVEVSPAACQCIAVTHPSRLYVTDDYVVTHNTWQMLYAAHYGWAKAAMTEGPENAQSRLFVSMEMSPLAIEQRLAAMHAHVPASKLKHATLATPSLKKLKKGLTEIKGYGSPFYIVDGNLAATVEDIYMLARQLKPDAIFVDGAYLTKHPTERDRYRRVAENAELMKSELASLAPTVASWQFAKTASKKKKGEKVTGDDIGYSDAIFQVSSLVLGLFEEDSVETLKQRMVEILKGRSGEVGHFFTHWNFEQMIFSEIEQTAIEDMQFM